MQMLGSGYWSTAEVFQHVNLCGQAGAPWLSLCSRSKSKVQSHPHLAGFHVASICPLGFPAGSVGTESACNSGDTRDACSIPGWGRSPWRRKWQPTPVFLPEKSHGQRSPMGYSPWGCKESDMTGQQNVHQFIGQTEQPVYKNVFFGKIDQWRINELIQKKSLPNSERTNQWQKGRGLVLTLLQLMEAKIFQSPIF